jgi:hypothetical protein
MLPGIQVKEINEQILDAFKKVDDLSIELKMGMDIVLGNEINTDQATKYVVFQLVEWAEQRGLIGKLIATLADARPIHAGMQLLKQKYAIALQQVSPQSQHAEYAGFFGNKPPVEVQTSGQPQAVLPAVDPGFEHSLKKALGFFEATHFATMLGRMSGRVCRIELNDNDGTMGTGFLVGPQAVLTNYHVAEKFLKGTHPAKRVRLRFDYFKPQPDSTPSDGVLVGLDLSKPDAWKLAESIYSPGEKAGTLDNPPPTAEQLDFALLRLDRAIGGESVEGKPRGWIDLPANQPPLLGLPFLMILQHPDKLPLKLAFDTDPKTELKNEGLRVRYQVNTERGSSGSPVFDKDWKLVALHHYGDPNFGDPKFNQGIPIGLVRSQIVSLGAAQHLGATQPRADRFEVVASAAVEISKKLEAGQDVNREEFRRLVSHAADQVTGQASQVQKLSSRVRDVIEKGIDKAEEEFATEYEKATTILDRMKATNKLKREICSHLKQAKELSQGEELPDEWLQRWIDLGCS